jgi:hypothetical protein
VTLKQLNLKLPPEVAAHWSAQARAEGLSVRDWLIARLGPAAGPAPAAAAELLERVAALEAAVAQLQRPASPERVKAAPRSGDALGAEPLPRVEPLRVPLGPGQLEIIGAPEPEAASPERVEPITRTGDALTTAELADQTGTSRGAWNNWAGKAAPGAVRHHPTAGSWRLVGKAPAPGGGPDRWLWEPVEA